MLADFLEPIEPPRVYLAICGASGGADANWGAANQRSPIMTKKTTTQPSQAKRKRAKPSQSIVKSHSASKQITDAPDQVSGSKTKLRITKQELVLTLLSRSGGATISDIMQATNWLEKSVRGFFAGTVKKKLGFNLTSVKKNGAPRRYLIAAKRGRSHG